MNKYIIQDKEAGNIIDEFSSFEEANQALIEFENQDRIEGCFTPDYYEIIEKGVSLTDKIKDIYLYDDEYIMIIGIPHQRRVFYNLVKKDIYYNLKKNDLDFFNRDLIEKLELYLDIRSWELAQTLNDLNNYYIISNDYFDESQFLDDLENNNKFYHKKSEIIDLLKELGE